MTQRKEVLIVSEDPEFLERARSEFLDAGIWTIACLGPAGSPCLLDLKGFCSIARHALAALVDAPPTGVFQRRGDRIGAGSYAERLASLHPELFVVLAGASTADAGPSPNVAHARDKEVAVSLITTLWGSRSDQPQMSAVGGKGDGS